MSNEKIKSEIWELLKSKGFKESSHSDKILKKEIQVRNPDSSPGQLNEKTVMVKFKFGGNNLQKFTCGFKNYSIPFYKLTIVDGKITKK